MFESAGCARRLAVALSRLITHRLGAV
jgi:hypothetical protein